MHCDDDLGAKRPQEVVSQLEGTVMSVGAGWLRAVDEEMICSCLGVATPQETYEQAKAKLNHLIAWHVQVACDPAVNGGFVLMPEDLDEQMLEVLRRDGYRALVAFIQNQDRLSA